MKHRATSQANFVPWLWTAALGVGVWALSYPQLRNSDLWWHLAAGRRIAARGIEQLDPWSYPLTGRWLNHEWLADLVFDLWRRAFGMSSLVFWLWGMAIATFALSAWTAWRLNGGRLEIAVLASLFAAATAAPLFEIRPHAYTLLGVAAVLALVLAAPAKRYWLVPIFAVWSNLHSGVVFGWALMVLLLGVQWLRSPQRAGLAHLALLGAAGGLACLANPFGIAVFRYPLRYALDQESPYRTLREWLPAFAPGSARTPLFVALCVGGAAAVAIIVGQRLWRRRPDTLALLAAWCITLAMALRSARFITLFAAASVPLLAQLSLAWSLPLHPARKHAPGRVSAALALGLLACAGVRLAQRPLGTGAFSQLVALESFPVAAADLMESRGLGGRVFAFSSYAGYLHFRLDDRVRTFIDGRADTVFDDARERDWETVLGLGRGWIEIVERDAPDFFLWPRELDGRPAAHPQAMLASGRWRVIWDGFSEVLLARTSLELAGDLEPPPSVWTDLGRAARALRNRDIQHAEEILGATWQQHRDSLPVCRNLAYAQALRGDFPAARRTHAECEALYPEPLQALKLQELKSRIEGRWRRPA